MIGWEGWYLRLDILVHIYRVLGLGRDYII